MFSSLLFYYWYFSDAEFDVNNYLPVRNHFHQNINIMNLIFLIFNIDSTLP